MSRVKNIIAVCLMISGCSPPVQQGEATLPVKKYLLAVSTPDTRESIPIAFDPNGGLRAGTEESQDCGFTAAGAPRKRNVKASVGCFTEMEMRSITLAGATVNQRVFATMAKFEGDTLLLAPIDQKDLLEQQGYVENTFVLPDELNSKLENAIPGVDAVPETASPLQQ